MVVSRAIRILCKYMDAQLFVGNDELNFQSRIYFVVMEHG
jgi:hypothetical protein